jgi:hypothetical protein
MIGHSVKQQKAPAAMATRAGLEEFQLGWALAPVWASASCSVSI